MRLLLELCAPLLQELNKKETITAAAASTIDVHMLLNAPRIVVRKEPPLPSIPQSLWKIPAEAVG